MADTDSIVTGPELETPEDFGAGSAADVARWVAVIDAYERQFRGWHERVPRIIRRYRDERERDESGFGSGEEKRFNVLWSNIKTLQPALYSATPKPEASRRHKDRDLVGRAAAEIVERAVAYAVDDYDFDSVMRGCRDDYLLGGRGQAWIRYIPTYGEEARDRIWLTIAPDGPEDMLMRDLGGTPEPRYLTPEGEPFAGDEPPQTDPETGLPYAEGEPYRPVVYEQVVCDHVSWRDFGHAPAPRWERVTAVWKRELMTRNQLVERFGDFGRKVPLGTRVHGMDEGDAERHGEVFKRALVYEIWDKGARKVWWICREVMDRPLDVMDDPLELAGFFPCPRPLYATTTPDSLVPVPDYAEYQDQADELDELTERISLLTRAIRMVGVYDGTQAELERLLDSGAENVMIPVANWAMFAEKGGIQGAVSWLPIEQVVATLQSLLGAREQVKRDLNEITGLSDIIRGQEGTRRETATTQRIKGEFASLRLRERQQEIQRFARDLIAIKAEIVAERFSQETLAEMTGWLNTPKADPMVFQAAVALLREDRLRSFRIDIETDSTVSPDRQGEQEMRIEFLAAVTPFLERAIPAAQQFPELRELLGEMLMFGVRGFRAGRHLETVFEDTLDRMSEPEGAQGSPGQEEGGQGGEGPDPAEMARLQLDQAQMQMDGQIKQAELQGDMEERQARLQIDAAKLQLEQQRIALEQEKLALEREKAAANVGVQAARLEDGRRARAEQFIRGDLSELAEALAGMGDGFRALAARQARDGAGEEQ